MVEACQPKHSATTIRLGSLFAHSDGLPCPQQWNYDGPYYDAMPTLYRGDI
jgi:hypothetical protein